MNSIQNANYRKLTTSLPDPEHRFKFEKSMDPSSRTQERTPPVLTLRGLCSVLRRSRVAWRERRVLAYTGVAELMSITELSGFIIERQSTFPCCQTVVGQIVHGRTHVWTQRYDTIRDAILTCARKPTWVGLIYRTESTTKNCKTEKLTSKNRCVRSNRYCSSAASAVRRLPSAVRTTHDIGVPCSVAGPCL